jgi:hypothetical protein
MSPNPSTARRPLNLEILEPLVARKKLKAARIVREQEQTVTLARDDFVPVVQADVGSLLAVSVYRYRLFIPVNQTIREADEKVQRVTIATEKDIFLLRSTIIRHFGGITMNFLDGPTVRGVGARDPQQPLATLEENEHMSFEVYAAPLQESDDYFRTLRKELQEALGEGVILIERQEIVLV